MSHVEFVLGIGNTLIQASAPRGGSARLDALPPSASVGLLAGAAEMRRHGASADESVLTPTEARAAILEPSTVGTLGGMQIR